jgi:Mg2+/Co2+ transporter CorB
MVLFLIKMTFRLLRQRSSHMTGVYLLIIIVLLGMSAFFSGSETALMAISRMRLRRLRENRPRMVKLVERMLRRPEHLIGTILLGNNLVNVAMTALATSLAIAVWGENGIIYVTIVLTLVILVFAETTPKVYAKYYNERVSFLSAPVLKFLIYALRPVILVVTWFSNFLLLLVGVNVRKAKRPLVTEADIKAAISMSWEDQTIPEDEKKMLSRVFTFDDKTVESIMLPKEQMMTLEAETPVEKVIETVKDTGFTRIPITENEEIIGILYAKDLFKLPLGEENISIREILRPPYLIPAERKIHLQLQDFKVKRLHQAVVVDSNGGVIGLVTLEDVLEELVGHIEDESDPI